MFIKIMIQNALQKRGWELRKIKPPRTEMMDALKWLRESGINITTVLDVGASNGSWTRICSSVYPEANYLMFEANPVHFQALNSFAYASENRAADCRAVGPGVGKIHFDARDPLGGGLVPDGKNVHAIEVPMVTLDHSIKETGWGGPYLIKLDTHGFEKGILAGALDTLENTNALVVECYNFKINKSALKFWEFCDHIVKIGFRPVRIVDVMNRKRDRALWQMDLVFVRNDWEGFSYAGFQ